MKKDLVDIAKGINKKEDGGSTIGAWIFIIIGFAIVGFILSSIF